LKLTGVYKLWRYLKENIPGQEPEKEGLIIRLASPVYLFARIVESIKLLTEHARAAVSIRDGHS